MQFLAYGHTCPITVIIGRE